MSMSRLNTAHFCFQTILNILDFQHVQRYNIECIQRLF